jgi:hypothetical protein
MSRSKERRAGNRSAARASGLLQRKCACGKHTVAGGECESCQQARLLQRAPASAAPTTEVPPIVGEVLQSPGRPLNAATRSYMEPRFGHNFGDVQVHTDATAAESASAVDALAYTVGRDVVFGQGQYRPESAEGRQLLAHELAHVVQQRGAKNSDRLEIGDNNGAAEREAEQSSALISTEALINLTSGNMTGILQRQSNDPRHQRGYFGEQQAAFVLYDERDGWATIRGPSGQSGHATTTGGEDGLFYNVRTKELHIVDNKSLARAGNVSSATAIDPSRNLVQNIETMLRDVERQSTETIPYRQEVLRLLRQTRAALAAGTHIPGRVKLVVTNAGGNSTGVVQRLQNLGVIFRDAYAPLTPRPGTARPVLGRPNVASGQGTNQSSSTAIPQQSSTSAVDSAPQATIPPRQSPPVQNATQAPSSPTAPQAATPNNNRGSRTTARVGVADNRLPSGPIPSPRGSGAVAAIQLAFMGLNFVLNWLNDEEQGRRVREALEQTQPYVERLQSERPDQGILLVFFYSQFVPPPDSPIQSGAIFSHIEIGTGATPSEGMLNRPPSVSRGLGNAERLLTSTVWIPPLQPQGFAARQAPFPKVALATFVPGRASLQDVAWFAGFDDEGVSTLTVTENITPRFFILRVPEIILTVISRKATGRVEVPVEERSAGEGGSIPVVNLDPTIPFSNVGAACIFPADDATEQLFRNTPPTIGYGQLSMFPNIESARWARPEQIKILQRL